MSVEAGSAQIGRLVQAVDFERVLRIRSRVQSVHFALHHSAGEPSARKVPHAQAYSTELSTGNEPYEGDSVDDLPVSSRRTVLEGASRQPVPRLWLGAVVPKRHARRAVTRSLLKRQIHAAVSAHAGAMADGLWVVRLRAGFDRAAFPSAASAALQRAARDELDRLLICCAVPRSGPA